ncbi:MAG: PEP-utilizing enzyme [Candidatus Diapherotrites archaeon]
MNLISSSTSKKRKWFVLELIRKMPLQMNFMQFFYWTTHGGITPPSHCAIVYQEGKVSLMFDKNEFKRNGKMIFKKILSNPKFYEEINKKIEFNSIQLFKASEKIRKTNLLKKTNKELVSLFREFAKYKKESQIYGMIGNSIEFEDELLSKHVLKLIQKKIKQKKLELYAGNCYILLSSPTNKTPIKEMEIALTNLSLEAQKNKKLSNLIKSHHSEALGNLLPKKFPSFWNKFKKVFNKFKWVPFMYEGPEWNQHYFFRVIRENLENKNTKARLNNKLIKLKNEEKETEKKQKELVELLGLNEKEKLFVELAKKTIEMKALRKDALYFGCFCTEKLYIEIGKRFYLTLNQVRYMLDEEIIELLKTGKSDPNELNERYSNGVLLVYGSKQGIYSGKKAQETIQKIYPKEILKQTDELHGSCAFEGKTKGIVKIIDHPNEMPKLRKGEILVSHSTNPNLISAMKRAKAIITDLGGITSHAAIVSRELKIPCVIGTKTATKILMDGDKVIIDARKGTVKKIK